MVSGGESSSELVCLDTSCQRAQLTAICVVVRQEEEKRNMCALRRHVCHSPDPVYAGPLVAMGGKHYSFLLLTKIDNILFLARNVCFRAQPGGCDVGGGGMSSILGSARSLLQEYAVKGALLCTAGTTFLFHSLIIFTNIALVQQCCYSLPKSR